MKSKIMITGGAGYIGSHAARLFMENGHKVVIVDNLHSCKKGAISTLKEFGNLEFYEVDLTDLKALEGVFEKESDIEAVLHFAGLISVSESMRDPALYFKNNVFGSFNLMECIRKYEIKNLVFSSTCAVYGENQYLPVDEAHPLLPTSTYGETKLMIERLIKWYSQTYELNYVIFRYFNVCGAVEDGKLGYDKQPSEHLIPNAVKGALGLDEFKLTYAKVETDDGSPVRDYVDVNDLVEAHFKAYEYLAEDGESEIINLGTGKGFSVEDVVSKVEELLDVEMSRDIGETRGGEFAAIYADYAKAKKLLNWSPQKTLGESISNLANWYKQNPKGFSEK